MDAKMDKILAVLNTTKGKTVKDIAKDTKLSRRGVHNNLSHNKNAISEPYYQNGLLRTTFWRKVV